MRGKAPLGVKHAVLGGQAGQSLDSNPKTAT